jgi:hypothetical protein
MVRRILGFLLLFGLLMAGCRVEENAPTVYPGRTPGAGNIPATLRPASPTTPRVAPSPTAREAAFTLTLVHSGEVVGKVLPCG